MRHATQYASSIEEWCDIMKVKNNGGYANAWLIGDIKTNEIARLELGLKYIGFEKKKDGFFTGSNVVEDLRILRFETRLNEINIKNFCVARKVRWQFDMDNLVRIDGFCIYHLIYTRPFYCSQSKIKLENLTVHP
jgi:hypothetical protein